MAELLSQAEKLAEKAENLPAFSGLKLLHIKREIEKLLGLIGSAGIFSEYTRHDISHIDAMLGMLDWMVPVDSRSSMSPADWMLVVLSVYFHDLGLLVTKREFEARGSSSFGEYRDNVLFAGDSGRDYRSAVEELPSDEAERFLYEEFVRSKHAERIRNWIMGRASDHLGVSHDVVAAINDLLSPLHLQFKRDLALVCESHHLDDLDDLSKYPASQSYGGSDAETANVQYAAILLRSADLLHITQDRTPSIVFRVLNPADPISQQEWAKQRAVTRVLPKLGVNRDGLPDESAPKDTIEVRAFFSREAGFFGLTLYLSYAADQLRKSNNWAELTGRVAGVGHRFPWRHIDDGRVVTEGFLGKTFGFEIDQKKILDLLTGHTLYNDTSVVLRELVQNALDAVRLQEHIEPDSYSGRLLVTWNSAERTLRIDDNGTGMTQEIVEHHLLKVGASRYEDPDFKKKYPGFSAISRFGIGVLSTFMVADRVEITTCSAEEPQARQLSLRSVHGKYLIRLLDKESESLNGIGPHGTSVVLKIRPSALVPDILETARKWVVVPGCEVWVQMDAGAPVRVGFPSVKEAVEDVVKRFPQASGSIEVRQAQVGGVSVAYAVEWNDYFREWGFLSCSDDEPEVLGTCIEGIRVKFESPGFDQGGVVAIANAKGAGAPKTNVARSGLEATEEREHLLGAVYEVYASHISNEVRELFEDRGFSQSWAASEAKYLMGRLFSDINKRNIRNPIDGSLLLEKLRQMPIVLIEEKGARRLFSATEVDRLDEFWTIESNLVQSAESFIREAQGKGSIAQILSMLSEEVQLPSGALLCGFGALQNQPLYQSVTATREVDYIRVSREQRRVDLRWRRRAGTWTRLGELSVSNREGVVEGLDVNWVVNAHGHYYFSFGNPAASFLREVYEWAASLPEEERRQFFEVVSSVTVAALFSHVDKEALVRYLGQRWDYGIRGTTDLTAAIFVETVASFDIKLFNAMAWQRET